MALKDALDDRMLKALNHPLRMQILTLLNQKVSSPSSLAEELGEPIGNVAYHVRALLDLDCIELVGTTPRRGAVEHHYRATVRPYLSDASWAEVPASVKRSMASGVLRQIAKDVKKADEGGGFERDDMYLTRTPLVLDQRGWTELNELLGSVVERAFEIQTESVNRLQAEKAEGDSGTLVTMLFENPPSRGSKAK